MSEINPEVIIEKFINKMDYKNNEHTLGCFFYGSYLIGFNNDISDIDLHIIFDNSDPNRLIRGNEYIDGVRVEYFEKPIGDIYLSIDNDFENQNNALLSIIGTSKIIFDKTGDLKKLQEYAFNKFSIHLPKLDPNDAREYVSILNNRMEKLEKAANESNPYFYHLYHLTIEKIRKFYHRLNGMSQVQTSKVFRIYTDEIYRKAYFKDDIPEEEFISMYLDAISDTSTDMQNKFNKVKKLFNYATRNVELNHDSYRIPIKSRNNYPRRR